MAKGNHMSKIRSYIFLFVALFHIFNGGDATMKDLEMAKHKGTVKTIMTEDGDVIDCVDIYKQPAFDHRLLKNHTIQMKPSSFPKRNEEESSDSKAELLKNWLKNGDCPEGTIPILRTQKYAEIKIQNPASIEYAQVRSIHGKYMGAQAYINVWNPRTARGDYSSAQIWVISGDNLSDKNVIQAGWIVGSDGKPRYLAGWTRDGYHTTGCYNLECPGFVQTNHRFPLGLTVHPVSQYRGRQIEIKTNIHKDMVTGNWWLELVDQPIGYWPSKLFTSLAKGGSTYIYWGGEVGTDVYINKTTEMGSGHFPNEGWGKSSFFRSIAYYDDNGFMIDPENLALHVHNPSWYNALISKEKRRYYGIHFYFGGPGKH